MERLSSSLRGGSLMLKHLHRVSLGHTICLHPACGVSQQLIKVRVCSCICWPEVLCCSTRWLAGMRNAGRLG